MFIVVVFGKLFSLSFQASSGSFFHSAEEKAESIPGTDEDFTGAACNHTPEAGRGVFEITLGV